MSKYLLEDSSGGYLLEDGSGVLLLESVISSVYAQTAVQVLSNQSYYAQSQGQILVTYRNSSQSRVKIAVSSTFQSYAQTNSQIIYIYTAPYGKGQAQAQIISFDVPQYAQSQTSILISQQVYAQATAWISIQRYTTVFQDTFSRTTTAPPFAIGNADTGQPWVWSGWDTRWNASTTPIYVNGSVLVMPIPSGQTYDSLYNTGATTGNNDGEFFMDIWIPASGDNGAYTYWYDRNWYFRATNTETSYNISGPNSNGSWPISTRSAWYTTHVVISTTDSNHVKIHFWKVGDTEPVTWTVIQTSWPVNQLGSNSPGLLDIYESSVNEASKFDNIIVKGVGAFLYNQSNAQVNANILVVSSVFSQALAVVNQSQWVGQAQTDILVFDNNTFSQTQAFIKKGAGYANAQAWLDIGPYNSYAYKVKQDGAVSFWPMEGPKSSGPQDIIGNYTLTKYYDNYFNYGSPYGGINPPYRQAHSFYYYYGYLYSPTYSRFQGTQWTFEGWVQFYTGYGISGKAPIFSIGSSVVVGQGGTTPNSLGNYVTTMWGSTVYNSNVTVDAGNGWSSWYYLALTYDNGTVTFYVNGVQTNQWNGSSVAGNYFYLDYSPYQGSNVSQNYYPIYDSIAAYNTVLTSAQVADHYIAGKLQAYAQAGALITWRWGFAGASWYIYNLTPGAMNIFQQISQAAVAIFATTNHYAQARVKVIYKDTSKSAQAQAAFNPFYVPTFNMGLYVNQDDTTYYIVNTPGWPNFPEYSMPDNAQWWATGTFVADVSGTWQFQMFADYSGYLNIDATTVLTASAEVDGGYATGSISLTEGTTYQITTNWYGDWTINGWIVQYMRPADTYWNILTSNNPPWTPYYLGLSQYSQVNAEISSTIARSQAQVYIKVTDIAVSGQAQLQIGGFRPGQAIAQIGYNVLGYRKAVLTDRPILYYPLDETYYGGEVAYSAYNFYDGGYLPEFAADGNTDNGWASAGYTIGEWWQVTWGAPQSILTVKVTNRPDYTFGSGRILYSNGTSYNVTFPSTSGEVSTYTAPATNVTWMRLISDSDGNGDPGFSEVEAYNGDATNLVRFALGVSVGQEAGILHTLVGRGDAVWNKSGATFGVTGSLSNQGTSIFWPYGGGWGVGQLNAHKILAQQIGSDYGWIPTTVGSAITVEFWMYWTGTDDVAAYYLGSSGSPWGGLYFYGGNYGFNSNGGDIYGLASTGLDNKWLHVAMVWYSGQDEAIANKIYINGVSQALSQVRGSRTARTFGQDVWLGYDEYSWNGGLDEFAIFDHELSAGQILTHFQARTTRHPQTYSGFGQAQFWYLTPVVTGQAQTRIKQTYPLMSMDTNYALTTMGATAIDSMGQLTPINVIDGNDAGPVWEIFGPQAYFENGVWIQDDEWLQIDFGQDRTVNYYRIVPVRYDATVSLQYWDGAWQELIQGISFNVGIFDPIDASKAIAGELPSITTSLWRLLVDNLGTNNGVSILTFELGFATVKSGTFAQAQASFGHFAVGQAGTLLWPAFGLTAFGQALVTIITTYQTSSQSNTWVIPPTVTGLTTVDILQTFNTYNQANTWIIPPTVIANAQARIIAYDVSQFGQAKARVLQTYVKTGYAKVWITKPQWAGQALVTILDRRHGKSYGQTKVYIGHFQFASTQAYITKNWKWAQAKALIRGVGIQRYAQATVYIYPWPSSQVQAAIRQTYREIGGAVALLNTGLETAQAQADMVQTYYSEGNSRVWIKQVYSPIAQALAVLFERHWVGAQARTRISKQYKVTGQAMVWVGYHKFSQAQARIIAFNVPKFGLAAGYIVVGQAIPPGIGPTSDYYTYLVRFNGHDLPGYAQSESYSNEVSLNSYPAPYIDGALSEDTGLKNTVITIEMLVWEPTYEACKDKVRLAATIMRSARGFAPLYIQHRDKYYLAIANSLAVSKQVPESSTILKYTLTFEARPVKIDS